jgi:hypothetical protein
VELFYTPPAFDNTDLTNLRYTLDTQAIDSKATTEGGDNLTSGQVGNGATANVNTGPVQVGTGFRVP